jgi:hypothetical protein
VLIIPDDAENFGCGDHRSKGVEILPSSPDMKGHRWIDRRLEAKGE